MPRVSRRAINEKASSEAKARAGRPPKVVSEPTMKDQKKLGHELQNLRISYGYTQAEMAARLGVQRSNYSGFEVGRINFLYYFGKLCRIFTKEEMVKVCGVDWDYYTAERVNVYAIYFSVSRQKIADEFGIAYSALRYLLRENTASDRYLVKYKAAIDRLFPKLKNPDVKAYRLCGRNSMACYKRGCIFIFPNVNVNRSNRDDEQDLDFLMDSGIKNMPPDFRLGGGN